MALVIRFYFGGYGLFSSLFFAKAHEITGVLHRE